MKKIALIIILAFYFIIDYAQETGKMTDPRDNQEYITVKIGKQTWMAENLNYIVPYSPSSMADKYGRLYFDFEATNACPDGWHLPSYKEWQKLIDYEGSEHASANLKAVKVWINDENANNSSGFSALPTISSQYNGKTIQSTHFWTSTKFKDLFYYVSISNIESTVSSDMGNHEGTYSIRCIKN